MSDGIKEKYNSYIDGEKPSEEFLSSLTERLKQEEIAVRRKKVVIRRYIGIAAAACIAICAAVPVILSNSNGKIIGNESHYLGSADTSAISSKPLKLPEKNESLNPASLAEMLKTSLDVLYESVGEVFAQAPVVSEERLFEIIEILSSEKAVLQPHGDRTNFMAVFNDGTIVKFSVYDNNAVTIK